MSFAGKRVLALESRRATETAELIRRQQGEPFVAPSMREAPLEDNPAVFDFAEGLFGGRFDMVIFTTGVGARYMQKALAARYSPERLPDALKRVAVVARGPKPLAVLREWGVPVAAVAPEPNTWHELLAVTAERPERLIAVQEYGRPNTELTKALEDRGATVTSVPVYQWRLPEDIGPLRQAAQRLSRNEFEAVLFTTSNQVVYLLRVAEQEGLHQQVLEGLSAAMVASIGPTTSETLQEYGVRVDMEPSHPKLGFLVKEAAEKFEQTRLKGAATPKL